MNKARIMKEIDIAHKMGINVFEIDAGWFGKTGDWIASKDRFPDDHKEVKAKMDSYGMSMGLWFNSDAAVSSNMLARNRDHIMMYNGQSHGPHEVWEIEESYVMCLVSPFMEDYANELIRVAKEYDIKYFFHGLARAVNARQTLDFDKWIPSTLFLTHFLADDQEYSQWINIGSLILGQNGIWGDLLNISEAGVERFGTALSKYKEERDDITKSHPMRSGTIGGSPEIHEKICTESGRGAVVVFITTKMPGRGVVTILFRESLPILQ